MRSSNAPVIAVKNLSVRLGGNLVLEGISADVQEGEIVAIIGPNGSGKTTFLRSLLGLVPYEGEARILGREPKEALGEIGYVPQRFSFDRGTPLTAFEFLSLSSDREKEIWEALGEVEMQEHAGRQLGTLSGGQLQRVLVARAILGGPKLLFLDEPTAGIDMEGEKNFYEIIRHQNQAHGTTVLMISHEMNMVYNYATQVICLNRSLVCAGRPEAAITKDVLHRLYGSQLEPKPHRHK